MIDVSFPLNEPPALLDRYLADGWFRSASLMARTPILCADGDIHAAVPVRVKLDGHEWSRSQRRLLRRNRELFRVDIGAAVIDDEREELYARSKPRFSGVMAESLEGLLDTEEGVDFFQTREVVVRDGDRMVAVSYFDAGQKSVASLIGLYDRKSELARQSLGLYTMLEEMEFAKQRGFSFYYPGWILLGHPNFQYKLQLGSVQYRTGDGRWRAASELPVRNRLCQRIRRRVGELERALARAGVPGKRWLYPYMGLNELGMFDGTAVDAPMLVECRVDRESNRRCVVEYLPDGDRFVASFVKSNRLAIDFGGTEPTEEMRADPGCLAEPLLRVERLARGSDARRIAARVAAFLGPKAA